MLRKNNWSFSFFSYVLTLVVISSMLFSCETSDPYDDDSLNGSQLITGKGENKVAGEGFAVLYSRSTGRYLGTKNGYTLYHNSNDTKETCNFQGDRTLWPSFYTAAIDIPGELDSKDFLTIVSCDGTLQTTYKGWPLYLYSEDAHPLEMNGLEEDNGMQLLHPNLEPAENKPTSSLTVSYDRNYGRYLSSGTDEEGFTLYFNTADKAGKCKFKGDRTLWPSFYLGDGKITTHEINSTDIDTIVSSDGTLQTTYKGWPLYLYSRDAHPLEMNGLEEDNEMQLVSPIISPAQ